MRIRKPWSQEEENRLKNLCESGLYSGVDMMHFFPDRTLGAIWARCHVLGIITNYKYTKYTYDENYFNELDLTKIYYGGLFMADGCIYIRPKHGEVSFIWAIARKDIKLLENFKTAINSTHVINLYESRSPTTNNVCYGCSLRIESAKILAEQLKKHFGMIPNKTKRFPPPNLFALIEKLAFIKGYLDGDGCLIHSNNRVSIQISSCNKEILLWIKNIFDDMNINCLSNRGYSNVSARTDENSYYYSVDGLRAAILYEIFMRINTPSLDRKWRNEELLNTINYWKSRPEWPPETFFIEILSK